MENNQIIEQLEQVQAKVQQNIKKKDFCSKLCDAYMKQIADLYLAHELMLEDEAKQRKSLAESFNCKMEGLTKQITDAKEERSKINKEHNDIREKIKSEIDNYKLKEQEYKDYMAQINDEVEVMTEGIKKQLDSGDIGKKAKANEMARQEYDACERKCHALTEEINGYVKKFDEIKVEVESNNNKFRTIQTQIETKRMEVQKLHLEIENVQARSQVTAKVKNEIEVERESMKKQVKTLQGLERALEQKLAGMK